MSISDDEINWVTLTLELPDELEAQLEKRAREEGLSLACYCIHLLFRHFLEGATAEQKERWQLRFLATLRRNGCADGVSA
jgi:hypothetical protein